ncbi:hypothetical protein ACN27J_01425 [Solwaraspora sp. WMMB762]|uniref:hypothetical protein n=1 Tax=Solwaraspora sp. WMMB762 TaxID=3404120 RepID=UPI003B92972B
MTINKMTVSEHLLYGLVVEPETRQCDRCQYSRRKAGNMRLTRKIISVLSLTAIALFAPATALAVNVSSNDGSGVQNVSTWYSDGATLTGNLRSTSGNAVYYSGQVAINNCGDSTYGRYTSNTTSTTAVTRGGTISASIGLWPCSFEGVKARVCRDINNLPDTCGSWSTTIRP